MDKDQAAAILGTAHDAHFDVDCEMCGGTGMLEERMGAGSVSAVNRRDCPNCDGDAKTKMPRYDEILHAAEVLTNKRDARWEAS